ncbi:myeloid-associated differentiation marker-like [Hippopotamus amphibius kiboko]|uniref:myeloid-associated differentiation marker-like n=1 Tax=Hippopotamus amphibius kiboko TaxID=575201 RepID=UPI002594FC08|nr:myeloid-associated differentiation marker-like [Hippopotamus amphibius kiboko]
MGDTVSCLLNGKKSTAISFPAYCLPSLHAWLLGRQGSATSAKTTAIALKETLTTMSTATPATASASGLCSPIQILRLFRVLQLLSTCAAFSLVASVGTWRGAISNWYIFTWAFCFIVTLFILIVELCGLQSCFPFYWYNFPINYACFATLFCLSAFILFGTTYNQLLSQDHAITATAFSCIAAVAYATEVVWTWACYLPGDVTSFMGTMYGSLKLLENFVASLIFAFISGPHVYQPQPALLWCVAVYSICFILGTVALLLGLVDFDNRQPVLFRISLLGLSLLSVLLYTSAVVLWPLYQFSEKLGGQPQRSSDVSCRDELPSTMCIWDQQLAVAILTAINLLIYVADTVYWALQAIVGTKDQPRGS